MNLFVPDKVRRRFVVNEGENVMTITVSRKVLYAVGGILLLVLAGFLGALIGGGGGGTTTTTVVETVEAEGLGSEEAEPVEEESEDAESSECDARGINREVGKEGTCTEDGVKLVVVDRESTLKLKELNATVRNMETTPTASDEFGTTKSANGVYVLFDLEVFNKTNSPLYFDSSQEQAVLYLGDNEYTEDFDVENYALDDSFVNKFEEIQAETATRGTIAFDIPQKLIPDLGKTGNLAIFNFSDEGEAGAAEEVGIIRTYK
ncbi:MAG TPA: DUF4352 domain-containing protein [Solirubrobacterales bacterium]|nr:DUF4352 domain-containing protein [Solirubrobacterales bacterium]